MAEPMGGTAAKPDNKRALWALILGIVGIICCNLAAPFAWYMGRNEVKAIDAGQSAKENRGMALAGMILGIIGTILLVLGLIWIVFFGGMAVISGMSQGMQ
jgi:hypothetical protein